MSAAGGDPDQLALVPGRARRASRARVREPAATSPVAHVAVDTPVAHLDRVFDYLVPAHLDAVVTAGCRVRVRLAGRLLDGFVLDRAEDSEHAGTLTYLERVLGEPVLTDEVAGLARLVADRQAGTLADVLRLAVPPRHAAAERRPTGEPAAPPPAPPTGPWERYAGGRAFLAAVSRGSRARAVWSALPGPDWPVEVATAVATALAAERGAIVVVPDARDVARVDAAMTDLLGAGRHVVLTADLGPAERYARFLALRRGTVRAVLGTRAAVWAPVVSELGLVVVWDDGDESLAEPRAPYPHARDVAVLRAHRTGAALLLGGHARSAEAQALLSTGWAAAVSADRAVLRAVAPRFLTTGADDEQERDPAARAARLPSLAWRTARSALESDAPVLVQVPRRGYVPSLACARCRAPARCLHCAGPLHLRSSHAVAACRWCGRPAGDWRCPECAGTGLRATVTGTARTVEELGRAFPGVPVRASTAAEPVLAVPSSAAVVVSTPGTEPVADEGYGAVLILDTWALLTRADLRAGEEALRRWFGAAALARAAAAGGRVVVVGEPAAPAVQALLRWDPAAAATRELAEREALHFPPAARLADLTGAPADIADLLDLAELPTTAELLGPVAVESEVGRQTSSGDQQQDVIGLAGLDEVERLLIRVPRADGAALAAALKAAAGARSARRRGAPVRVRLDPSEIA